MTAPLEIDVKVIRMGTVTDSQTSISPQGTATLCVLTAVKPSEFCVPTGEYYCKQIVVIIPLPQHR
jgi:hypothetical protein